jgi:hypothetical protein
MYCNIVLVSLTQILRTPKSKKSCNKSQEININSPSRQMERRG